jgi:hypothetical protein
MKMMNLIYQDTFLVDQQLKVIQVQYHLYKIIMPKSKESDHQSLLETKRNCKRNVQLIIIVRNM